MSVPALPARKSEVFFQNNVLPIIKANGSSDGKFSKYARFIANKNSAKLDLSLQSDSTAPVAKWVKEHGAYSEALVRSASLNPFGFPAEFTSFDLLTDSGTSRKTPSQQELREKWGEVCSDVNHYAYARSPARHVLDLTVSELFGDPFKFHLTLQGRASEFLLLGALGKTGVLPAGSTIVSNTPFDTTKGHIMAAGNHVKSCTPATMPEEYASGKEVFLGNLPLEKLKAEFEQNPEGVKAVLLTMTNNGGGGQPVSMENIRAISEFARENGLLIWFDTCRIFENAAYIKAYEPGYSGKSLQEIAREIMSYCDVATISFKKIYAHNGGGIFLNKNSPFLGANLEEVSQEISKITTVVYGNGFESYSGTTADTMIEAVSGLLYACSADNIGARIAQVHRSYLELVKYGVPVTGGGHALYIAADQMFPNLKKSDHPAEFLQALNQMAFGVRGCGLGYIVYGFDASMDSLRYAFPREVYSQNDLAGVFSLIGKAYDEGIYRRASTGVLASNYVEDGFYHFHGKYALMNDAEFVRMANELRELV